MSENPPSHTDNGGCSCPMCDTNLVRKLAMFQMAGGGPPPPTGKVQGVLNVWTGTDETLAELNRIIPPGATFLALSPPDAEGEEKDEKVLIIEFADGKACKKWCDTINCSVFPYYPNNGVIFGSIIGGPPKSSSVSKFVNTASHACDIDYRFPATTIADLLIYILEGQVFFDPVEKKWDIVMPLKEKVGHFEDGYGQGPNQREPLTEWLARQIGYLHAYQENMNKAPEENDDGPTPCASCNHRLFPGKCFKCSACKQAYYCNRVCQRNHWKVHRRTCCKDT